MSWAATELAALTDHNEQGVLVEAGVLAGGAAGALAGHVHNVAAGAGILAVNALDAGRRAVEPAKGFIAGVAKPVADNARLGLGYAVGVAVDPVARAISGTVKSWQNWLLETLISLVLKLSFAVACSLAFFVGLFWTLGADSLEVVDRGSLLQCVSYLSLIVATVLLVARLLLLQLRRRSTTPKSLFLEISPYVLPLVVCVTWFCTGYVLAVLIASAFVVAALTMLIKNREAGILAIVLLFGLLGIARADRLMFGAPSATLVRAGDQAAGEPVNIVLSSERGLLLITAAEAQHRRYEFVPWDGIKSLIHDLPKATLWSRTFGAALARN